ncbi:DUF1036 domain-containing protein [Paenibacillus tengchongensis]|uniref:DUF1036 domain-containing protein n=1 Tax=Paenibacillus tengchongensis TaxID=2608684 RepID=UPI00124CA64E|nr:DUF1036 domain-containing protein [Paenibacillus tengchongensis]
MGFYVQNNTPNPVWVAIGYYDPNCNPITYVKRGWYRIIPGRRSLLVGGSAANQYFYIYAEDNANNYWGGDYYTYVPDSAFTMCWIERCQGEGCNQVGFEEIQVGNFQNFTLILTNDASTRLKNTLRSKKRARKFKLGRSSIRKTPGKVGSLGRVVRPRRRQ